jgi:hypothetical protein
MDKTSGLIGLYQSPSASGQNGSDATGISIDALIDIFQQLVKGQRETARTLMSVGLQFDHFRTESII